MTGSRFASIMLSASLAFALPVSGGEQPSFDVASVKAVEATEDLYRANLGTAVHGTVELTNATLADCLKFAYGYSNDAQLEGPDWIQNKGVRFNIQAKAPPDTPRDQLLLMLQKLLSERFQLALKREQKTRSYLALVVGKKGLKMQPVPADAPAGSSVYTAVQEQLGLRLEARKGPLEVLVVDHAAKTALPN